MAEAEQMSQLTSDKHSSVAGLCSYLDFLNWSCPLSKSKQNFLPGCASSFCVGGTQKFQVKDWLKSPDSFR